MEADDQLDLKEAINRMKRHSHNTKAEFKRMLEVAPPMNAFDTRLKRQALMKIICENIVDGRADVAALQMDIYLEAIREYL